MAGKKRTWRAAGGAVQRAKEKTWRFAPCFFHFGWAADCWVSASAQAWDKVREMGLQGAVAELYSDEEEEVIDE
ncbi:hypothetical protein T484DRAFT_1905005 [Baffinella frigidus]|nr:hypothetical protein T484DRAFT_1905005 [Cryptophyta sp. CCMP2293]